VQTCLSIATVVASESGPVASSKTGKRLGSPPHEQPPRTSHHRANAGPCIIEWQYFGFASAMLQTSNTSLDMYLFVTQELM
jgi:hypothetical protein